jgi:hypothetical protein
MKILLRLYFILLLFLISESYIHSESLRNLWEKNYNWNLTVIDSVIVDFDSLQIMSKLQEDKLWISGYEASIDSVISPYSYNIWDVEINFDLLENNVFYLFIADSLEEQSILIKMITDDKRYRIDLGPTLFEHNMNDGFYDCYLISDSLYSKRTIYWSNQKFKKFMKHFYYYKK